MPAPAPQDLYTWRAAGYDLELWAFEPLRQRAIAGLVLQPGQTVLDLGCGTGLSLPLLQAALGPGGRIIGIEQCPAMLARAHERVASAGWRNVELRCEPVAKSLLAPDLQADAALFHFTHDILQDPEALRHLSQHLRAGAALAATGLLWAPPWAPFSNLFVLAAAAYSIKSFQGLEQPWRQLRLLSDDLQVRKQWMGSIYQAWGHRRG